MSCSVLARFPKKTKTWSCRAKCTVGRLPEVLEAAVRMAKASEDGNYDDA